MKKLLVALCLLSLPAFAADPAPAPTPTKSIANEPNMKMTKDSGGTVHSYMINDAPLPNDFVLGKRKAPVVIVEYASLSCPHCAHFSNTVLPDIQKKYIDSGKVAYILRPFPLNEPALKGAMLLDCVGNTDADKYYVFAKVLFDAQNKWAFDGNWLAGLETISAVGGISKEQFTRCITNTEREVKILKDKKVATDELKIDHTPYFFIDGQIYDGDRSIEALSQFIDARLAKK